MNKFLFVFVLVLTALLSSCTTGGVILRETPLNVSETRKVIVTIIGEPRLVSENGRDLYSKYYDKKDREITKMNMAKERYSTQITILGDQRPYDVQVQVLVENRDGEGGFELTDHDDERAAIISEKLKKALHQSRNGRNIIDDFRSF